MIGAFSPSLLSCLEILSDIESHYIKCVGIMKCKECYEKCFMINSSSKVLWLVFQFFDPWELGEIFLS